MREGLVSWEGMCEGGDVPGSSWQDDRTGERLHLQSLVFPEGYDAFEVVDRQGQPYCGVTHVPSNFSRTGILWGEGREIGGVRRDALGVHTTFRPIAVPQGSPDFYLQEFTKVQINPHGRTLQVHAEGQSAHWPEVAIGITAVESPDGVSGKLSLFDAQPRQAGHSRKFKPVWFWLDQSGAAVRLEARVWPRNLLPDDMLRGVTHPNVTRQREAVRHACGQLLARLGCEAAQDHNPRIDLRRTTAAIYRTMGQRPLDIATQVLHLR